MIKSSKGLGELDNLDVMRFRRWGTISASSFMASPAEGPYEASVESSTARRGGPAQEGVERDLAPVHRRASAQPRG